MKIAIASDHGGYGAKKAVVDWLTEAGYSFVDLGPDSEESVDYPIYAGKVCDHIQSGLVDRGILICGTGIGMSMAANKDKGIRAALCNDLFAARLSREHNDSNVLCMGGRPIGPGLAKEILFTWLETEFEGDRHLRRISMFS